MAAWGSGPSDHGEGNLKESLS